MTEALRAISDQLPRWLPAPLGDPAAHPPPENLAGELWPAFRDACRCAGVESLLATAWEKAGDEGRLDPLVHGWLRHQRWQNRLRVERLQEELAAILEPFAAEELPLLPLKGPVVGEFYPDPTLRPMNDLDLFLPEEHFPRALEIFAALGYEHTFTGWKHAKLVKPGNRTVLEEEFEHRENPRYLELHPRCRERIDEDVFDLTDRLYASARREPLLGVPTLRPSPGEEWLYFLLHASHHILVNNFRLVQLVDLALLLPRVEDPAGILASVDPRVTYAPLYLLHKSFPGVVEEGWIEAQRQHLDPAFAHWVKGLDLYGVCYLNPVPWRI